MEEVEEEEAEEEVKDLENWKKIINTYSCTSKK